MSRKETLMKSFLKALEEQRWDDHRFYHHSRINQSLHVLSALSFLCSYVLLFSSQPAAAALVGWLFAMVSRQTGHFVFEPSGYDEANQMTHDHKEEIKVGYNLRRKVVLLSIWALVTILAWVRPALMGLRPPAGLVDFFLQVAKLWLWLGAGAVVFRTVHLFFLKDVQTGLVWFTKILTDPFHDLLLYYKAPLYLLRGELMDPIVPSHQEVA
jgi:hypothetical protein